MNRLISVFISVALVSGVAHATETPQPMQYDARIRSVVYNPDNVVKIVGTYGISTHIIFSPTETIRHVALGDSLAWEVAPIGNNLWMKPTEPNAYTNLSIVTNRRSYEFELIAKAKSRSTAGLYYMVQFQYPQDVAAARAARLLEKHDHAHTDTVNLALNKAELPVRRNINYWVRGAAAATPDEAFDDGTFTYFRFKGNREFPAVFLETVGPDGKKTESLVNTTVKGDTIVVQRLASHFMLRKGSEVAEVVNKAYDPIGTPTGTGTITKAVKRVVNGDIDPHPASLQIRPDATPPAPIDYSPVGDDSVTIHTQNVLPPPPSAADTPAVKKPTAAVQVFKTDKPPPSAATASAVPDATAADVAAAQPTAMPAKADTDHMPPAETPVVATAATSADRTAYAVHYMDDGAN